MRVAVCAIAKNENLYINEWVRHYINIGVDKIFLYDNNDKETEFVGHFIDEKLREKVKIINVRGLHYKNIQAELYSIFYSVEKNNYQWFIFCDVDEYLTGTTNVKKMLSKNKYSLYKQIRVKWKLFGDDNLITRDMSKSLIDTFKEVKTSSLNFSLTRKGSLENQGKAIIKGGLSNIAINSPHYATNKNGELLTSCLPSGRFCRSLVRINEDYSQETIFFNHYMTKSLSEFINQKMNRTDAVFEDRILKLDYYWRINEKTKEKINYLKKLGYEI